MTQTNKKIWFEIPFTGIEVRKRDVIRLNIVVPYTQWLKHNHLFADGSDAFVTFIRNPFDRVILQYEEQNRERPAIMQYPMTFDSWCKASFDPNNIDPFIQNNPKEFLSQKAWLEGSEGSMTIEKIDAGASETTYIKRVQKVVRSNYYSEEIAQLILSWYSEDFEMFNFDTHWK